MSGMKNFTNCNNLENLIKFMNNLKVLNEDDWEEICIYLMQHLVLRKTGNQVYYQRYGRRGERQHGIDLIPMNSDNGIYAQCKHKSNGVLTANEVLQDLQKTEQFPHQMNFFLVFTTSNRDTSIQDQFMMREIPYKYVNSINPNGFSVQIIYWDTIQDLSWLPIDAQRRFFPSLFQNTSINQVNPIESILALKSVIPKYLNENNILWLENWNFREKSFVYSNDYNPFFNLYLEYDRAKNAIDLAIGYRAELFKAIPSGTEVFNNLEALYLHVHAQMIGEWDQDGQNCLFVRGHDFWVSNYLIQLNQLAKNLAEVLRSHVFSQ